MHFSRSRYTETMQILQAPGERAVKQGEPQQQLSAKQGSAHLGRLRIPGLDLDQIVRTGIVAAMKRAIA